MLSSSRVPTDQRGNRRLFTCMVVHHDKCFWVGIILITTATPTRRINISPAADTLFCPSTTGSELVMATTFIVHRMRACKALLNIWTSKQVLSICSDWLRSIQRGLEFMAGAHERILQRPPSRRDHN